MASEAEQEEVDTNLKSHEGGNVSSAQKRPVKKKKKAKRSRFSSLRLRSSTDTSKVEPLPDDVLQKIETPPLKHKRATSVDITDSSPRSKNQTTQAQHLPERSITIPEYAEFNETGSARPQSKKKKQTAKRWTTMRTAASRIMKPENSKTNLTTSRRNSELGKDINSSEPTEDVPPSSPFPGINHHQTEAASLTVAVSLPSKRMKQHFAPANKSLRQQRDSLLLPGTSTKSKKKQKNLALLLTKKAEIVTDIDKVKMAPLVTSKSYTHLQFSSKDCKLGKAKFLQEFQDNIKSIDFSNNALKEFPLIEHLKSLKRLDLSGNQIETFSLSGLENLQFLALENNKISMIPQITKHDTLINLDLRGNKLQGGFKQLEKLPNLSVLDISRCMLDMSLEKFETEILAELKKLKKLSYLCIGDNPIVTRFPELKYIIIHELSQLQYFDYVQIQRELRESAALVKEGGIEALRLSSHINKEDKRLKAEQMDSIKTQSNHSLSSEAKRMRIDPDATKSLPESLLIYIFSLLPTESVSSCFKVCKRWHQPATDIFVSRCVRVLKNMNIIVSPDYYRTVYAPYIKTVKENSFFSSIESRVTPISCCDEELFATEKVVIILVTKENRMNAQWSNLYEQLSYRYCENLYKSAKCPYQHLRYAIYEVNEGSMAAGIDTLLHAVGATRISGMGSIRNISFDKWLEEIQDKLPEHFQTIHHCS